MTAVVYTRYYTYSELVNLLTDFAEAYPQLMEIQSIGKSYEGREIFLAVVTNHLTGEASEKTALWIDGNIHATELAPSTLCLMYLEYLLVNFDQDELIKNTINSHTIYICPRVNPDGAEWALADNPRFIRSSTRPYPYDEEIIEGLIEEDIDGDGRILSMRIQDPNGAWKIHAKDPRLMIPRDPVETGGIYYRVLPEGRLENYDGVSIRIAPSMQGMDFNRNFPYEWRPEQDERGAGPFPTSEPEVRSLVEFISQHINITAAVTFHTYSGVLLRPYSTHPDEDMPSEDLWVYQKIGLKGTEMTGYPNASVYHDFRYHPKKTMTGAFDDWMYDERGVFAWTAELWSPQKQAGIEKYKWTEWWRDHPEEDDLKLMDWNDNQLDGKGYIDWYEFNHPQLGQIELGGWDMFFAWRNPPPCFLENELRPFPNWLTWQAMILPYLDILEVSVLAIAASTYRIRMVICNTGWLPSYGSKKALEKNLVRGVIAEIDIEEEMKLITGLSRLEIGQLEGRAYTGSFSAYAENVTNDRIKVEWVVYAPQGGIIHLTARHDRAGTARRTLTL
jgi:murein tripeptide amidase MpaA